MYSPKILFTGVALVGVLASWAGAGCSSSSPGGTGNSTTSNSSVASTGTSGGSSTVGSGGGGTGGTGTGGSTTTSTTTGTTTTTTTTTTCACMLASDCAPSLNSCVATTCANCTCGTANLTTGTTCNTGGGKECDGAGNCVQCLVTADCAAGFVCDLGKCAAATCIDQIKDGVETDVDCGGGGTMNCPPCPLGKKCLQNSDCASAVCDGTTHLCVAPPPNNTCATAEMHTLHPGDPALVINATTTDSTEDYTDLCGDTATPPAAPSLVYGLTLTGEGTFNLVLKAATGSTLLPVLDIRQDCTMPAETCNSYGTSSVNVDEDMPAGLYYVIVNGSPGTSGAFTLTATLTAGKCGDGVINPGETCDPGTVVANDGCNAPGATNQCQVVPAPASEDACPGQPVPAVGQLPAGTTMITEATGMSTYGF